MTAEQTTARARRSAIRPGVWSRRSKRATLLARDGGDCWLCGYPLVPDAAADSPLRVSFDHVVEVSEGGTWDIENLRLAHAVCNQARGQVHYALLQITSPERTA